MAVSLIACTPTHYYQNGAKASEGAKNDRGCREGEWKEWWPNGQRASVAHYSGCLLTRHRARWNEQGRLVENCGYRDQLRHSLCSETWQDGDKRYIRGYHRGIQHGMHREWYRGGQLREECLYEHGQRAGCCRYWDELGTLLWNCDYSSWDAHHECLQDPANLLVMPRIPRVTREFAQKEPNSCFPNCSQRWRIRATSNLRQPVPVFYPGQGERTGSQRHVPKWFTGSRCLVKAKILQVTGGDAAKSSWSEGTEILVHVDDSECSRVLHGDTVDVWVENTLRAGDKMMAVVSPVDMAHVSLAPLPDWWMASALRAMTGRPKLRQRLSDHWKSKPVTVTPATPKRIENKETLLVRSARDFAYSMRMPGSDESDSEGYAYHLGTSRWFEVIYAKTFGSEEAKQLEHSSRRLVAAEISARDFLIEQGYRPISGRNDGRFRDLRIRYGVDGIYMHARWNRVEYRLRIGAGADYPSTKEVGTLADVPIVSSFADGDQLLVLYRGPLVMVNHHGDHVATTTAVIVEAAKDGLSLVEPLGN